MREWTMASSSVALVGNLLTAYAFSSPPLLLHPGQPTLDSLDLVREIKTLFGPQPPASKRIKA